MVIGLPSTQRILKLEKTWEIRDYSIEERGIFALVLPLFYHVVGHVKIVDCIEIESVTEYNKHHREHCLGNKHYQLPYPRTYAWVLADPVKYTGDELMQVKSMANIRVIIDMTKPGVLLPKAPNAESLWS